MNSASICNYVNNEGVSEVWMYGYQGPGQLQIDESSASPASFTLNGSACMT